MRSHGQDKRNPLAAAAQATIDYVEQTPRIGFARAPNCVPLVAVHKLRQKVGRQRFKHVAEIWRADLIAVDFRSSTSMAAALMT